MNKEFRAGKRKKSNLPNLPRGKMGKYQKVN